MEEDVSRLFVSSNSGSSTSAEAQSGDAGGATGTGSISDKSAAQRQPNPSASSNDRTGLPDAASSSGSTESEADGSMSSGDEADSDASDYIHVQQRACDYAPLIDQDLRAARELAKHLRARPLLPGHPLRPEESFMDVDTGVEIPMWHCAFKGCCASFNSEASAHRGE